MSRLQASTLALLGDDLLGSVVHCRHLVPPSADLDPRSAAGSGSVGGPAAERGFAWAESVSDAAAASALRST